MSVRARVSPVTHTGTDCPQTFTFTGKIHVSHGPVTVRYRWIRSDGAISPVKAIRFSHRRSWTRTVSTTWTLSASGTHWAALRILSPRHIRSRQAAFTLTCEPPAPPTPAASARASVDPPSYSGPGCPRVFTFTGQIRVSTGPATVQYRWIRSDGGVGPTSQIAFSGSGPQEQTVSTTWGLGTSGTHWEAVEILSPNSSQSNHATFTLNCQP
jgi:hypothetical protein